MEIQTISNTNSKKSTSNGNSTLKYGLLLGVILSLVLFFRYLLNLAPNAPISRTETLVALFVILVLDIVYVCLNQKGRKVTFSKILLRCWWISTIASVLYGVFLYVYACYIDNDTPSYIERCTNTMLNSLTQNGQEVSGIDSIPMSYMVMYSIMSNVIVGFVASLLTCIILKCLGFIKKTK